MGRAHGLLHLQEERILVRIAEEQGDIGPGADAADAHDPCATSTT